MHTADFRQRVALALVLVSLAVTMTAVPVAAAPPGDKVQIVDEQDVVDCGGESLTLSVKGWIGLPGAGKVEFTYHLPRVYTNSQGDTWRYVDTGMVRVYERNGDTYWSLSGHSVNVGPGETGWYGHVVGNGELTRAGRATGDVDQAACAALTS